MKKIIFALVLWFLIIGTGFSAPALAIESTSNDMVRIADLNTTNVLLASNTPPKKPGSGCEDTITLKGVMLH